MPSIRLDKQIFPFFDSVKNPVTAPGVSDSFHNNGFSIITIEINKDAVGYVEGCVNIIKPNGEPKTDNECEWSKLGLINLKNYDVSEDFNKKGHYIIGINGMARIRVVLTDVDESTTILGVAEV